MSSVEAQSSGYDGLDILFLVDQSGSMGGSAFGHSGEGNDPLGLRFQAVQYALQTLSEYRRVVPDTTVFRMSVISFGDATSGQATELTLPWTVVPEDSTTLDSLLPLLSDNGFRGRNLGNTDFLSAYEEAQRQFTALPNTENHLRVIVILTDGAPCAPERFSDSSCQTPADQNELMDELVTLANNAFPAPNYRLFAIAIDNRNEYWNRFAGYWTNVVRVDGSAERIENSTDIGPSFLEILAQLIGALRPAGLDGSDQDVIGQPVEVANQTATIDLPPYHQAVRLTVFKTQPVAGIVITDPSGNTLNEASPQVTVTGVNGAIETWTITNPQPGRWRVVTAHDADLIDIYLDLIRVTYDIEVPATAVARYDNFNVTLRIFDSEGDLLPTYTDPRYHLDVQTVLHAPNGVSSDFPLALTDENIYTGELLPEQAGVYTLALRATTTNVDGSLMTVIEAPTAAEIEVVPVNLTASLTPEGEVLISEPIRVIAHLSAGGAPLDESNFQAEAVIRGGEEDLVIPLFPGENAAYAGDFVMDTPGQYQASVRVKRALADGSQTVIAEQALPLLRVNPADFIALRIAQPQPDATIYTTAGFPPLTPNDLIVEVIATRGDGAVQPLEALLPDGAPLPLLFAVRDEAGADVTSGALLASIDDGVYRATLPDLGTGQFTVTIQADNSVRLGNSTLFDPRFAQQSITVHRAINPGYILTLVLTAILIIGAIASGIYYAIRTTSLRKHPAAGRLTLFSEDLTQPGYERAQTWSFSLDRVKKNYIVIKRPPAGLKRIQVECTSDAMARQKQVLITVEAGGKKIVNREPFRPGTERRLDAISTNDVIFILAKDPES